MQVKIVVGLVVVFLVCVFGTGFFFWLEGPGMLTHAGSSLAVFTGIVLGNVIADNVRARRKRKDLHGYAGLWVALDANGRILGSAKLPSGFDPQVQRLIEQAKSIEYVPESYWHVPQ